MKRSKHYGKKSVQSAMLLIMTALLLAAGLLALAGCGGGTTTQTVTQTTVKTVTIETTTPAETQTSTSGGQGQTSAGPYATESAAIAYVQAQQEGMSPIDPDSTWKPNATLHVIHATTTGGASYGGDFYYFFVNGNPVGNEVFTSTSTDGAVDSTTFAVTYNVFMSGDPHCCPSGGTNTVQFHWNGSQLVTVGSMQGAEMS